MSVFHDEVEIEDFDYDPETQTFTYPCPCGDLFQITLVRRPAKRLAPPSTSAPPGISPLIPPSSTP